MNAPELVIAALLLWIAPMVVADGSGRRNYVRESSMGSSLAGSASWSSRCCRPCHLSVRASSRTIASVRIAESGCGKTRPSAHTANATLKGRPQLSSKTDSPTPRRLTQNAIVEAPAMHRQIERLGWLATKVAATAATDTTNHESARLAYVMPSNCSPGLQAVGDSSRSRTTTSRLSVSGTPWRPTLPAGP